MSTPSVTRFFLARLVLSFGVAFAAITPASRAQAVLRIEVVDRSGTLAADPETRLFLGASFNSWNPGGTEQTGWLEEAGERVGWVFEVPRALVERGGEFKFTRGSWATVESDAHGDTIDNRRTGTPDWSAGSPVLRCEVLGFEDRLRAPTAAEDTGSVVGGTLEVWTLHSDALDADRTVRVWLPEMYTTMPGRAFGVLYLHDGQNVFDTRTSAFGVEWQADEAVTALARVGTVSPVIVVGIDNSGQGRAWDYLPFSPGSTAAGMRGGGADDYLRFVIDELMPEIARRYRVKPGPEHTGLGGSSFGGVITLYAVMSRPGVFGTALVESPSLWVGDGKLMDAIKNFKGEWPGRMFLGMGDAETGREDQNERLVRLTREVEEILRTDGLGEDRLRVVIGEGQRHNEAAWQERLPGALEFLLGETPGAEPDQ